MHAEKQVCDGSFPAFMMPAERLKLGCKQIG